MTILVLSRLNGLYEKIILDNIEYNLSLVVVNNL
jgi:hypothetical protein